MWLHDMVNLPEMESRKFELPERSLLYRIPVMGDDTGQIEGLLSYLVRVARAHSVNPRRLVRTVFAPGIPELENMKGAGFFLKHAKTVNGLGRYAELFLCEVSRHTKADFLRPLCLLPLQELLPLKGAGLLAWRPKWCPCCVSEMIKSGEDVFRPLVWSLELYNVCTLHSVRLQEVCSNCGKFQPFIPRYPDWGRCDHCGWTLGDSEVEKTPEKLDRWTSKAITDLVQHLEALDGQATSERFVAVLREAVACLADGKRTRFCKLIGLPYWAMTGWMVHCEKPTLPQLLSVAYGLDVMPSELFLQESGVLLALGEGKVRVVPQKLFSRQERPLLNLGERKRLAEILNGIVSDVDDVRPLADIAKSQGLTTSCMRYWFAEECAAILSKHRASKKLRSVEKASSVREIVREVVRSIRSRGEYPSRRKVNSALVGYKLCLVGADMLRAYREAMSGNME